MIMVFFVENIIIDGFIVTEVALLADADLAQKIECPVDGGQTQMNISSGYPPM
jgi:hypothetical protein